MLTLLLGAAILIAVTVSMHGAATSAVVSFMRRARSHSWMKPGSYGRHFVVPTLVVVMLFVSLMEASLWATYYVADDWLPAQDALYFSVVTMTTLGYGDITLSGNGRLISGLQAAMGIVLFGWTTALIFNVVEILFLESRVEERKHERSSKP